MIFVCGIGISTDKIRNCGQFLDYLADPELYKKSKKRTSRNALAEARQEAGADGLPEVHLNTDWSFESLEVILQSVHGKTAFLCEGKTDCGEKDAVVIVLSDKQEKYTLAGIEIVRSEKTTDISVLSQYYISDGAVKDALSFAELVLRVYFGFEIKDSQAGLLLLDADYHSSESWECRFGGSLWRINRLHGDDDFLIGNKRIYLFPVSFFSTVEAEIKLQELMNCVSDRTLGIVSYKYLKRVENCIETVKTVTFLAGSSEELREEIKDFQKQKKFWFDPEFVWGSRRGSCFYSKPIGKEAKVCFICPPGGMTNYKKFYHLYRLFPELRSLLSQKLYRTSFFEEHFVRDYIFEIASEALLVQALKILGIRQDAVLGISLGELSVPLVFDSVCWKESDTGKTENTEVKAAKLFGDCINIMNLMIGRQDELCKCYYNADVQKLQKWYVTADLDGLYSAAENCKEKKDVFISIIGSPNDAIICGTEDGCRRLIDELHCLAFPFSDPVYSHTPVLDQISEELLELFKKEGIHYKEDLPYAVYDSFKAKRIGSSEQDFAESSTYCLTRQISVPDSLNLIYQDGSKIFIDLGSSRFCSRWVRGCLKNKDVVCLSPYEREDAEDSILSLAAVMLSAGGNIDISCFLKWYKNYIGVSPSEKQGMQTCFLNYDQIIKITENSVSNVLGRRYLAADQYPVRARMPMPPFLFVSRIIDTNAVFGELIENRYIEAEYDIPEHSILSSFDGTVSPLVLTESGHVGILLASLLGVDELYKGQAKYRITDVHGVFYMDELPPAGSTVRMTFIIEKFIRTKEATLIYCSYNIYLKGRLLVSLKQTGGFFSQKMLESSTGVLKNDGMPGKKGEPEKAFRYPITNAKGTYSTEETAAFYNGKLEACFGLGFTDIKKPYLLPKESRFIDHIREICLEGGAYGLGSITAEKEIDEEFWPFRCHFLNDPVLPGSVMIEGLTQTLYFFIWASGLVRGMDFSVRMLTGQSTHTKFRAEVRPRKQMIIYKVYPKKVSLIENEIQITADGEVFADCLPVIFHQNFGMRLCIKGKNE